MVAIKAIPVAIAVAIAATAASAQVFVSQNEAGGEIVLTLRACIVDGKAATDRVRAMYSYASTGQLFNGCWGIVDGNIHVIYEDGSKRLYPIGSFEVREVSK